MPLSSGGGAPSDLVTQLYQANYKNLVRLAAILLDETAACEDVVQEAYVRTWSRQDRLREPAKALAYMRQTVVNLSRSTLRRRLVSSRHTQPASSEFGNPYAVALATLQQNALVSAVHALSRRHREVIVLRYLGQMSEVEVADALQISVGSVKAYGSRGLAQLAQLMKEWQ